MANGEKYLSSTKGTTVIILIGECSFRNTCSFKDVEAKFKLKKA
jgi:hypothetical protein